MNVEIEVHGVCDEKYRPVREAFAENFSNELEVGASLAITEGGRSVVDLWAGHRDTVLNNCSWAHRILGNEVMALELAQRAAAMTGMGWGRSSLHLALIINGRGTEVVEEAQERPGGVPPLNMSYALVALGRYQEALDHARKAAGLEPRNPYRWTELANILGHLGRNDEALRAVESVRDLMPKWRFASSERGMQVMWRNNPEIVGNMLDGLRKLGID